MLRITRIDGQDLAQTLKLEGKLLEPWIPEVLDAMSPPNGTSSKTSLDLSGLSFVDRTGVQLLQDLIRRGHAVSACSSFIADLLRLEKS